MSSSQNASSTQTQAVQNALNQVLDAIDQSEEVRLGRLAELIAIPSISTDPAYDQACHEAANWVMKDLASIGFEARVIPAVGKPYVYAEVIRDPKLPCAWCK